MKRMLVLPSLRSGKKHIILLYGLLKYVTKHSAFFNVINAGKAAVAGPGFSRPVLRGYHWVNRKKAHNNTD